MWGLMNDQKIGLLAAGGVAGLGGSAALLASCCAAPWAVALFGTAAAAALARNSYLHPYLLVAAALPLGGVFWLAYRQRPADQPADLTLKLLAWSVALSLAVLAVAARAFAA